MTRILIPVMLCAIACHPFESLEDYPFGEDSSALDTTSDTREKDTSTGIDSTDPCPPEQGAPCVVDVTPDPDIVEPPDFTACDDDTECRVVSKTCCSSCEPSIETETAINKGAENAYIESICVDDPICAGCEPIPDPNLEAICSSGACKLIDTDPTPYATCFSDIDCTLRPRTCCPCNGSGDDVVAINTNAEGEYASNLCGDNGLCPECGWVAPDSMSAVCEAGLCQVRESEPLPDSVFACELPSQCMLTSKECCGVCGEAQLGDMISVNEDGLSKYVGFVCAGDPLCPDCPSTQLNPAFASTCATGNCKAIDLTAQDAVAGCSSNLDCKLRVNSCCACADPHSGNLIAVNVKETTELQLREVLCDEPQYPCDSPDCQPVDVTFAKAICDLNTARCVVKPL